MFEAIFASYGVYTLARKLNSLRKTEICIKPSDSVCASIIKKLSSSPEEWTLDTYTLDHNPSGLEIWTGCDLTQGPYIYTLKGQSGSYHFSFLDRQLLRHAIKNWERETKFRRQKEMQVKARDLFA